MENVVKVIDKIEEKLSLAIKTLVGAVVIFLVSINVLQVITRYFINAIITWVEDVSILGVLCIAAVGVPYAWFKGTHLEMDVTDAIYSAKVKRVLWYIGQMVGIVASISLTELGIYNAKLNFGSKATGLQYDESIRYIPLVVCGILLCLAAVMNLIRGACKDIQKKKSNKTGGEEK